MPKTQHTSPCAACPFSRKLTPFVKDRKVLGGSNPLVYIGQANGPFALPCHSTHDYSNLGERLAAAKPGGGNECAGAAIFRANVVVQYPDVLLHLPPSDEKVFGGFDQFFAHHYGVSLQAAQTILQDLPPALLTSIELAKARIKEQLSPGSIRVDLFKRKE